MHSNLSGFCCRFTSDLLFASLAFEQVPKIYSDALRPFSPVLLELADLQLQLQSMVEEWGFGADLNADETIVSFFTLKTPPADGSVQQSSWFLPASGRCRVRFIAVVSHRRACSRVFTLSPLCA